MTPADRIAQLEEELAAQRRVTIDACRLRDAALKRAEEAERGLSTCIDDDGTPFASARTWREAYGEASALNAELVEAVLGYLAPGMSRRSAMALVLKYDARLHAALDAAGKGVG